MTTRPARKKARVLSGLALRDLVLLVLDDWVHQYAPEFCNDDSVARTRSRIAAHGGTLAYIADMRELVVPKRKRDIWAEQRNALHCQARGCDGCAICRPRRKRAKKRGGG